MRAPTSGEAEFCGGEMGSGYSQFFFQPGCKIMDIKSLGIRVAKAEARTKNGPEQ